MPSNPASHPEPRKPQRVPAAARKDQILKEAAAFFSEQGFGGTTRDLARRLGITQAALYKHFPSKNAIITALFEHSAERWRAEDWRPALGNTSVPLAARLTGPYTDYLARMSGQGLRLFIRAGLDGLGQPARRGAILTSTILEPVIEAVRHEAGLPSVAERPILHREREVAMALHGGLMFLAIRKHVYRMPMPEDLSDLIGLQVKLWLPGAQEQIRALHASTDEPQQLAPKPERAR
jgi:AcrR family transcriptional regulator